MSTKFVSKHSNYMIVLKPGTEGNRALGTHAVSGLYVKFQSGSVDVKDEAIIEMLRDHPGYGTDFLEIKQEDVDPYLDTRTDIEPDHVTAEIKYGHVENAKGAVRKPKLTPQVKKLIEKEALSMIPGLLKSNPDILKGIILELAADMKAKEPAEKAESEADEPIKKGPSKPSKKE